MKVKVWGARGSIPTPGRSTNRYGGNTSCLQVTLSDGRLLVLDAGSGIRALGLRLAARPRRTDILLTHLHHDHIQGLMFFAPLFMPDAEIVIWGPPDAETLRERLTRYLSPPLTPLNLHELPARISFRACPKGEWEIGPARILTQYHNIAADGRERGSSATLGIESGTGTDALRFSFNEPLLEVEPGVTSIRYTPPPE